MRIGLSSEELWTLIDCLGHKGNELNSEFSSIQNYFKHNREMTLEYFVHCCEVTEELIEIATLQIRLLNRLSKDSSVTEDIKAATDNLKLYQDAYDCFISPVKSIEVQVKRRD